MLRNWMMAPVISTLGWRCHLTEFFEGSDITNLIQRMLAHIKEQTENPKFPESSFTLYKIMLLYINFHRHKAADTRQLLH